MIIILAEKPKSGERIAKALDNRAVKRTYMKHPYWEIQFRGRRALVIPLKGHIFDVDFPPHLSRWKEETLFDLLNTDLVDVVTEKKIYSLLKKVAPSADEIIIATDYDREGEAIGLEAARVLVSGRKIPIRRAKFSSLDRDEILQAFENLHTPNKGMAEACYARRDVDLLWGAVLTRSISLVAGKRGRDFLSVGRVQTPTLNLVMQREDEIRTFKPMLYYVIDAVFEKKGAVFPGTYAEGKIWQKEMAENLYNLIRFERSARVQRIERKEDRVPRPSPFDTTTFLKEAHAHLGLSAGEAMRIAEDLYMSGLVSYPRTDNQSYPPNMDFRKILKKLTEHELKEYVEDLLQQTAFKPSSGRKTKDHPPIHPVGFSKLSGKHKSVYDLIVRRFLATLLPPAVVERRTIHINLGGVPFKVESRRIVQKGWLAVYPYRLREKVIPELGEGDVLAVKEIKLKEEKTKPPPRYSVGELLKRMEALGLGTKSTRAEIIEKLYARKYLQGKKRVKPTKRAEFLVNVLSELAPEILSPELTSNLEKEMGLIEEGQKRREDVVSGSKEVLRSILEEVMRNKKKIGERAGEYGT